MAVVVSAVWFAQFFLAGLRLSWVGGGLVAGAARARRRLFHAAACREPHRPLPRSGERRQLPGRPLDGRLHQWRAAGAAARARARSRSTLPDAHADFIFAVAGEELGLVVCLVIVALFAFIVLRGFSRLLQESNLFVVLAATGLFVQFGLQAIINMASSLHLMPTKGMTLPFISYGGSSLLALALGMGMALALTRRRYGGATNEPRSIVLAAGGTGGHMFPAEALARELLARGFKVALVTDRRGQAFGDRLPGVARPPHPRRPARRAASSASVTALAEHGARHDRGGAAAAPRWRRRRWWDSAAIPRCRPCSRRRASGARRRCCMSRTRSSAAPTGCSRARVGAIATSFAEVGGLRLARERRASSRPATRCGRRSPPCARTPYVAPAPDGPIRVLVAGRQPGRSHPERGRAGGAARALRRSCAARLAVDAAGAAARTWPRCAARTTQAGIAAEIVDLLRRRAGAARRRRISSSRAPAPRPSRSSTSIGRPAILVPYRHAADDHQTANARALAASGAALGHAARPRSRPRRSPPDRRRCCAAPERARRGRGRRARAWAGPTRRHALADLVAAAAGGSNGHSLPREHAA